MKKLLLPLLLAALLPSACKMTDEDYYRMGDEWDEAVKDKKVASEGQEGRSCRRR